jgi:hypothetical protein
VEFAEMNIYSPNDEIVKRGEKLTGAILVARGEVEVLRGMDVERKMKPLVDMERKRCLKTRLRHIH